MKANYHTHSKWCHHGGGEVEDFIKTAIEHDFVELAITEHVPHIDRFTWMSQEEFLLFNDDMNRNFEKYHDRIKLRKGFECEYLPQVMDLYKRYRDQYGFNFFILGQHMAGEDGEINMFAPKDSEGVKKYCEAVINGLETGFFAYLAHPDLCLIDYEPGWDKVCETGLSQVLQACSELRIPIEYNAGGLRSKREYPSPDFWKMARNYDVSVLVGADAHQPDQLCDWAIEECENALKELGIKITEML